MVEGDSLSENHDFSTTEHPVDPRPVCKLEFVRCGPVEKKLETYYRSARVRVLTSLNNFE